MQDIILEEIMKSYQLTPIKTGNLRYHAMKVERIPNGVKLYVDEEYAPYMPYTNEPWIHKRWKGKKNPNEKWFEKMAEDLMLRIAHNMGGTICKH